MKIILAGPDGVGKSTFGKKLADALGYTFVEGNTNKTKDKLLAAKEQLKQDKVVLDRFFIPDHIVYSKVKNIPIDDKEMTQWADIIIRMSHQDIVILYMDALDRDLKARLTGRGDEYIEWHEISAIRDAYQPMLDMLKAEGIPVIKINSLKAFNYVFSLD